jgi:phosphatidylethanolamine/phosphatidyl-N-methylethanolamine N-methyltransferase
LNTNRWNRWRYTLYAPIYDWVVRSFNSSRKHSIELLALKEGERVLLVGAGTGEDLQFIPVNVEVSAVDITPAMVEQIRRKSAVLERSTQSLVMDAQALEFPSESFDAVVLHLILAVIPDPIACIQEAVRVVRPGGQIVIFDKFLPENEQPSLIRRLINKVATIIFSDLNRKLEPIMMTVPVKLTHVEATGYKRLGYKIALYHKAV